MKNAVCVYKLVIRFTLSYQVAQVTSVGAKEENVAFLEIYKEDLFEAFNQRLIKSNGGRIMRFIRFEDKPLRV